TPTFTRGRLPTTTAVIHPEPWATVSRLPFFYGSGSYCLDSRIQQQQHVVNLGCGHVQGWHETQQVGARRIQQQAFGLQCHGGLNNGGTVGLVKLQGTQQANSTLT